MSHDQAREAAAVAVTRAVAHSRRYRAIDPSVVRRLADEELSRARSTDDAVKRVKRRLHQAVGAYRPRTVAAPEREMEQLGAAQRADPSGAELRSLCRDLLERHASTRERMPFVERFYAGIWDATGRPPASLVDLGCGLAPLALPWMGLPPSAHYTAIDADAAAVTLVEGFLSLVAQPHEADVRDLAVPFAFPATDVALLLKLVPILDRQDPDAAQRLIEGLSANHVVVSFPVRSLGGHRRGMETTYRRRTEELIAGLGARVRELSEASIPNELVMVMTMGPADGAGAA